MDTGGEGPCEASPHSHDTTGSAGGHGPPPPPSGSGLWVSVNRPRCWKPSGFMLGFNSG